MSRRVWQLIAAVAAVVFAAQAATGLAAKTFPDLISLPDGWRPEGVVTGRGPVIYAGSLANGAIYAADLRTGEGSVLVSPPAGRVAVGLDFDARTNYIFAAGGATGEAYVYDATTGTSVQAYTLAPGGPTFVNDVVVTRDAAYFTDSARPVLYRIPLGPGGRVPGPGAVEEIALGAGFPFVGGQFNGNGIVATPDGKSLIVVNSFVGNIYRVDPETGEATEIDLGADGLLTRGDGLLLRGQTLYVVRNAFNEIKVVRLTPDLSAGTIVDTLTNPNFDVPTTIAGFGSALYAVNARFGTPPTPTTTYTIVRVPLTP